MNLGTMTVLLPSIALLIAAVFGAPATTAFAADDPFKNKVSIEIDEDNKNTCDESDNGNNNAGCIIADTLNTEEFTAPGEKNKISLDFEKENKNDCDEKGDGNNNAECIIALTKNIGPISINEDSP